MEGVDVGWLLNDLMIMLSQRGSGDHDESESHQTAHVTKVIKQGEKIFLTDGKYMIPVTLESDTCSSERERDGSQSDALEHGTVIEILLYSYEVLMPMDGKVHFILKLDNYRHCTGSFHSDAADLIDVNALPRIKRCLQSWVSNKMYETSNKSQSVQPDCSNDSANLSALIDVANEADSYDSANSSANASQLVVGQNQSEIKATSATKTTRLMQGPSSDSITSAGPDHDHQYLISSCGTPSSSETMKNKDISHCSRTFSSPTTPVHGVYKDTQPSPQTSCPAFVNASHKVTHLTEKVTHSSKEASPTAKNATHSKEKVTHSSKEVLPSVKKVKHSTEKVTHSSKEVPPSTKQVLPQSSKSSYELLHKNELSSRRERESPPSSVDWTIQKKETSMESKNPSLDNHSPTELLELMGLASSTESGEFAGEKKGACSKITEGVKNAGRTTGGETNLVLAESTALVDLHSLIVPEDQRKILSQLPGWRSSTEASQVSSSSSPLFLSPRSSGECKNSSHDICLVLTMKGEKQSLDSSNNTKPNPCNGHENISNHEVILCDSESQLQNFSPRNEGNPNSVVITQKCTASEVMSLHDKNHNPKSKQSLAETLDEKDDAGAAIESGAEVANSSSCDKTSEKEVFCTDPQRCLDDSCSTNFENQTSSDDRPSHGQQLLSSDEMNCTRQKEKSCDHNVQESCENCYSEKKNSSDSLFSSPSGEALSSCSDKKVECVAHHSKGKAHCKCCLNTSGDTDHVQCNTDDCSGVERTVQPDVIDITSDNHSVETTFDSREIVQSDSHSQSNDKQEVESGSECNENMIIVAHSTSDACSGGAEEQDVHLSKSKKAAEDPQQLCNSSISFSESDLILHHSGISSESESDGKLAKCSGRDNKENSFHCLSDHSQSLCNKQIMNSQTACPDPISSQLDTLGEDKSSQNKLEMHESDSFTLGKETGQPERLSDHITLDLSIQDQSDCDEHLYLQSSHSRQQEKNESISNADASVEDSLSFASDTAHLQDSLSGEESCHSNSSDFFIISASDVSCTSNNSRCLNRVENDDHQDSHSSMDSGDVDEGAQETTDGDASVDETQSGLTKLRKVPKIKDHDDPGRDLEEMGCASYDEKRKQSTVLGSGGKNHHQRTERLTPTTGAAVNSSSPDTSTGSPFVADTSLLFQNATPLPTPQRQAFAALDTVLKKTLAELAPYQQTSCTTEVSLEGREDAIAVKTEADSFSSPAPPERCNGKQIKEENPDISTDSSHSPSEDQSLNSTFLYLNGTCLHTPEKQIFLKTDSVVKNVLQDMVRGMKQENENHTPKVACKSCDSNSNSAQMSTAESLSNNDSAQMSTAESLSNNDSAQMSIAESVSNNDSAQMSTAESLSNNDSAQMSTAESLSNNDSAQMSIAESVSNNDSAQMSTAESLSNNDSAQMSTAESLSNNDSAQMSIAESVSNNDSAQMSTAESLSNNDSAQMSTAESLSNNDSAQMSIAESVSNSDNAQMSTTESLFITSDFRAVGGPASASDSVTAVSQKLCHAKDLPTAGDLATHKSCSSSQNPSDAAGKGPSTASDTLNATEKGSAVVQDGLKVMEEGSSTAQTLNAAGRDLSSQHPVVPSRKFLVVKLYDIMKGKNKVCDQVVSCSAKLMEEGLPIAQPLNAAERDLSSAQSDASESDPFLEQDALKATEKSQSITQDTLKSTERNLPIAADLFTASSSVSSQIKCPLAATMQNQKEKDGVTFVNVSRHPVENFPRKFLEVRLHDIMKGKSKKRDQVISCSDISQPPRKKARKCEAFTRSVDSHEGQGTSRELTHTIKDSQTIDDMFRPSNSRKSQNVYVKEVNQKDSSVTEIKPISHLKKARERQILKLF